MSSLPSLDSARTPERPGPGAVPAAFLRALELSIGRRMEGLLAGDYRSALLGQGTELAQVRPYVPCDDVRRIEWNVTARTGEPHVRVHLAERVLVTWLVLDASPSMQFGTADRRRADVAEGVAIAVGHVATRRGNRLGAVTFGDTSPRSIPPRQGRVGVLGLLTALRAEGEGAATDSLGEAIDRAGAAAPGRYPQREAAGAVRGRRGGRAGRGLLDARRARRPARRPLDRGRVATATHDLPAPEAALTFQWPEALAALAVVPLLAGL